MSAATSQQQFACGFHRGIPFAEYARIDALNNSSLKNMARSPLHFRHFQTNNVESRTLRIGSATHTAVLEPHRFLAEYAMWDEKTESGRTRPKGSNDYKAFEAANKGKRIITPAEYKQALLISQAVRANAEAMALLNKGEAEVSMVWDLNGVRCKARVDWLRGDTIVGLKTTRNAGEVPFGNQSAKLQYTDGWAFYEDGFRALTGRTPTIYEIAVENTAPFDVVPYRIRPEIIDAGRDEYMRLFDRYVECVAANHWPGVANGKVLDLTLPNWAFEEEDDEDLGLED